MSKRDWLYVVILIANLITLVCQIIILARL